MLRALKEQHQEAQTEKQMQKHKKLLRDMDAIDNKQTRSLKEGAVYQRQEAESGEEEEEIEMEAEEETQEEVLEEIEEMAVDEKINRKNKQKITQKIS